MSDVDNDVREMLRQKADELEGPSQMPRPVLRRAQTITGATVRAGRFSTPDAEVELHFGTLIREEGLPPQAPYALFVTVAQLGNTGDGGIWSVIRVRSDLVDLTCGIGSPV